MNAVGSFVESLAPFVDRFWLAFNLGPKRSRHDVSDHRARMTVGGRRRAGAVGNLKDRDLNVIAIQVRQGVRWLILSQTMSMRFLEMNEGRQEAEQMPLWTQKVAYDAGEQTFRGKGPYADYEVTKTF